MQLVFFLNAILAVLLGANGQTVQRQILFLVDSTSSISSADFVTYKQAFESVADLLDLESGQTQAAIAQYGNQDVSNIDYTNNNFYQEPTLFGDCATAQCFRDAVNNNMPHQQGANTFTATAIERAVEIYFASSPASAAKYIVLTTDGAATDSFFLAEKSQLAVDAGITSYAIGIGSYVVSSEIQEIARSGAREFFTTFADLSSVLQSIVSEIVPEPPPSSTPETTSAGTSEKCFGL